MNAYHATRFALRTASMVTALGLVLLAASARADCNDHDHDQGENHIDQHGRRNFEVSGSVLQQASSLGDVHGTRTSTRTYEDV